MFLKRYSSRAFRRTLDVGLALWIVASAAHANGWEHGAIPFDALIKALNFEQAETRRRAAQSLGFRGQSEAVEHLLARLARPEPEPQVRAELYTALGRLGDIRATPALTACLRNEARKELRGNCAAALGLLADAAALPQLLEALGKDDASIVRHRVTTALGHFEQPRSVATLIRLATSADEHDLRAAAITALGRTGAEAAVKPLLDLLAAPDDDHERLHVVRSLARLRAPAAAEPLSALLEQTGDPLLRARIVIALGAIREGSSYPTFIELLSDKMPAIRYFAVKGLHELADQRAAVPLATLSLKISRRMRRQPATELLADPAATLADLTLQVAALRALTDLDPQAGASAFLDAAQARDLPRDSANALKLAQGQYERRRNAIYGLGYTHSREAAEFLAGPAGLGDPDARLRAVAARSLGVLGFPESLPQLLIALDDPVAEARWTVAAVLGRLGASQAAPQLIERLIAGLADSNSQVRKQVALALGYLADPRGRDALTRAAGHDESALVREAAAYALTLLPE